MRCLRREGEKPSHCCPRIMPETAAKPAAQHPAYLLTSFSLISLTLLAESFRFSWICKGTEGAAALS